MNKQSIFVGDEFELNCGSIATVLQYNSSSEILIKTNTGYKDYCNVRQLKEGTLKDNFVPTVKKIGFLGFNPNNPFIKKGEHSHITWNSMIGRCYSNNGELTGYGIVSDGWHNFKLFNEWHINNYIKNWQLDKDLLFPENKIYEPNKCIFVPHEINNLFKHKIAKKELPFGVCLNRTKGTFKTYQRNFYSINKAREYYWKNKYNDVLAKAEKYPELKNIILNFFEYYKEKNFGDS